jgi:hypothetical protein
MKRYNKLFKNINRLNSKSYIWTGFNDLFEPSEGIFDEIGEALDQEANDTMDIVAEIYPELKPDDNDSIEEEAKKQLKLIKKARHYLNNPNEYT